MVMKLTPMQPLCSQSFGLVAVGTINLPLNEADDVNLVPLCRLTKHLCAFRTHAT